MKTKMFALDDFDDLCLQNALSDFFGDKYTVVYLCKGFASGQYREFTVAIVHDGKLHFVRVFGDLWHPKLSVDREITLGDIGKATPATGNCAGWNAEVEEYSKEFTAAFRGKVNNV